MDVASRLSDTELVAEVKRLVRCEREATAQLISRLAEFEQLARKKFAASKQPRARHAESTRSRHIPARVKRAVWLRDGGRCAFVGSRQRRCTERGFLEFHHVAPYAMGGEATMGNIQLRCRAHNAHEAELFYGVSRNAQLVPERVGVTARTLFRGSGIMPSGP